MADKKYTSEQLAAITHKGGLLVSAAAGSGKTACLVERVIRQIIDPENPLEITDFLIVTFTNAAAEEMKERISSALRKSFSDCRRENPSMREHLLRQLSLVHGADIFTIHSFCASLARAYFHLLDLPPDFKIIDEAESKRIRARVLDELINSRYSNLESDPDFALLADTLSGFKSDAALYDMILQVYEGLCSLPFPYEVIAKNLAALEYPGNPGDTLFGREYLDVQVKKLRYVLLVLSKGIEKAKTCDRLYSAYGEALQSDLAYGEQLLKALSGRDFDEISACLAALEFKKLKPLTKYDNLALQTEVKAARDAYKNLVDKFTKGIMKFSAKEIQEDMAATAPCARALFSAATEFERLFFEEKRRISRFDCNDLEKFALRLLTYGQDDSGNPIPSAAAAEISSRYHEIMVDEYQDTSAIQDSIFAALSGGEKLFLVGDVKQSIYRFRMADPSIFLSRYMNRNDLTETTKSGGFRLDLNRNFRSRAEILDFVNFIFSNIMSADAGEIDYTEREALRPGAQNADYPEYPVEINFIDMKLASEEYDEDSPRIRAEARMVAARVRQLLDSRFGIKEGDGIRPARPGDFAVLLRSLSGRAEYYREAFSDLSIAAITPGESGNALSLEVGSIVTLLSFINDETDELALVSSLTSPLFGFSEAELTEIRLSLPGVPLYKAFYAYEDIRAEKFKHIVTEVRGLLPVLPVSRLISRIFEELSALAVFGGMENGEARKKNLLSLIAAAQAFEKYGQGLHGFLDRISSGKSGAVEPQSGTPDAVTLTTIHKSKGLEFPVVILADAAKEFNDTDRRAPVLRHSRLGLGFKRRDMQRLTEYTTLPREAVSELISREMRAEEMRILYVALTRAREKLIITAAVRSLDKLKGLPSAFFAEARPHPDAVIICKSYAEWISLCVFSENDSSAKLNVFSPDEINSRFETLKSENPAKSPDKVNTFDQGGLLEIIKASQYVYPYRNAGQIPSKITASGVKSDDIKRDWPEDPVVPDFIAGGHRAGARERGTALHLAMQLLNFEKCSSLDEVKSQLVLLNNGGFITNSQFKAMDAVKIWTFFTSPLGQRIAASKNVKREFKFSVLLPANEAYEGLGLDGDEILMQGVIDLFFEEEGGLTIVDFKSDRVAPGMETEEAGKYRPQLEIYTRALAKITGSSAIGREVFFFQTGCSVCISDKSND